MRARHVLLAVFIAAIWGVNFSLIKLSLAAIDPFVLAGVRFALCAVPAVFFVRKPAMPWRFLVGYGMVFGVGCWAMVNLGIAAGVSAGVASLVLQMSAFFTMMLGAAMFRETLTPHQYVGAAMALAGLICIALVSDGSVTVAGLGLVLAGAASWSVANAIVKKSGPSRDRAADMLAFVVWSSLFSPIPLFVLGYLHRGVAAYTELWRSLDADAVGAVLFQVYPVTVFGYWAWNRLLRQHRLSQVAPFSLLVPVFGLLGSMVVFGENLPLIKGMAITFIVLGLVVGVFGHRPRRVPTLAKEIP